MNCPKCHHDLSNYEQYDNMYCFLICPGCSEKLFLDYYEDCSEDYLECYDVYTWETSVGESYKLFDKPNKVYFIEQ